MPAEDLSDDIMKELDSFVHDDLKVLSYKWVARQYSISANHAKRILFQYVEDKRDKIRTVYLVSGWTKQEPPSHVHQLVEAKQLQVYRESLDVTGMHVYSVAPNQDMNPDSVWQTTHVQSQQLLKEVMSGQPSASAEAFRSNSCSAVRFTAPPPPARPSAATPGGAATAVGALGTGAKAQPQQAAPQQTGARSPMTGKDASAAGKPMPAAAVAAAAPLQVSAEPAVGPSTSPPKLAGASPPKATGPSPPKAGAAGGKAAGKGAAAAAKPSKALANMWSKAATKPKAVAEPSAVKAEPAALEPLTAAADTGDEDDDADAIRMAARNGRGQKRRGAQIEDSDEDVQEAQDGGPGGATGGDAAPTVAADGRTADAPSTTAPPVAEAKGKKAASKGRGTGKAAAQKADKEKGGAKRAKTAAAKEPNPEPAQDAVQPEEAEGDVDMDDAVLGALDVSAAAPTAAQAAHPPVHNNTIGAGNRGRKVSKTHFNDDGEEVTEEVYEDGPAPLQPQHPPQQQTPQAAAAAKGAAKPVAKPAAPAKAKGKAPAAGQKSMTSFFAKK